MKTRAILEAIFGQLLEKSENYCKTTIELYKLKLVEQSANLVSFLLIWFLILILFLLVIFMLSIGLSLFIGDFLGKNWLGFLIVSLLNIAIAYLLYYYRNNFIKVPVTKLIVKMFENL